MAGFVYMTAMQDEDLTVHIYKIGHRRYFGLYANAHRGKTQVRGNGP